MVLDASLINTQYYKVPIKGKWNNPEKIVEPSSSPQCSSYWKVSLRVVFNYGQSTYLPYLTAYKAHWCLKCTPISEEQINKKLSNNFKRDEINMMNIINDNTFNLHNSLLNYDIRYTKVTLKSKQKRIARLPISTDYHEF